MSCENVFKHGEKLKKCDQCDFTFSDAGILKHTVEKIQTSATSVTLHQSRLSLWGNIWKRIVEKSQTSATNMIFKKNPLWYLLTMRAFMSLNRNDCEQWEHTNGYSPVCLFFVHLQIWKRARNKLTLVARIRFVCFLMYLMWRHLVAKYATTASGAMLLINLIQVTESISGSVVPLGMYFFSSDRSFFCDDEPLHWSALCTHQLFSDCDDLCQYI